jgi:hypothetical protein
MIVVATVVLVVLLCAAALLLRDGRGAAPASTLPSVASTTAAPTVTVDPRAEVVTRLREILSIRNQALESRDANLLESIYTTDCPCLQGDGDAIRGLLRDRTVWRGVSTTIQVEELDRVTERQWIVIASFVAAPFRVERESGELIRQVPGERNRSRFALAKPVGRQEWLLGHVSRIDQRG